MVDSETVAQAKAILGGLGQLNRDELSWRVAWAESVFEGRHSAPREEDEPIDQAPLGCVERCQEVFDLAEGLLSAVRTLGAAGIDLELSQLELDTTGDYVDRMARLARRMGRPAVAPVFARPFAGAVKATWLLARPAN